MKKRLISMACAFTVLMLPVVSARAVDPEYVAADAVIVRPVCFVGTILGSALFVVTLPFTAPCCGVHRAAHALVVIPGRATFTRDLGDMEALSDE